MTGVRVPVPKAVVAVVRSTAVIAGPTSQLMSTVASMAHQSDSLEQRLAEPEILAGLAAHLGVELEPKSLRLAEGSRVDIDGVSADESVLVEVFARHGRLKGAQFHKFARDALKLITVARDRDPTRLFIAFGDAEAAACVTGKSWLAEALRTWHVETFVAELSDATSTAVRLAQTRQTMVNVEPIDAADGGTDP